jgi:protein-tyrosine-phosphatase
MIDMPPDRPFTLLLVCTGNICRSPVAERLASARLADALGEEAPRVRVLSAGVRALVDSPMDPASARALEELGGDPAGFRATRLTEWLAAEADLTLTMTRSQRTDVLSVAPRAMSRTFTLREAAGLLELLELLDPGEPLTGDPQERARALVKRMAMLRSRRPSGPDDDIADPIGQDDEVHRRTARAITEALIPVLGRLAGALDDHVVGSRR